VNLILLLPTDRLEGDRYVLEGRRAAHLAEVLRAEPGRSLRVGLLEGPLGDAAVETVEEGRVVLRCRFDAAPPPRPRTDLLLAIPRPKSLAKLLPEIAALGVDRLVLMRTWRTAKPYLTAKVLQPETFRPLLHAGLMQARCTREPRVGIEPLFRPFVEDRAAELFAGARRLVAHPLATLRMASLRIGRDERVALAVGPEGGFLPYEVEKLAEAGFEPVSMGPRTLRVETACTALLAQIALLRDQDPLSDSGGPARNPRGAGDAAPRGPRAERPPRPGGSSAAACRLDDSPESPSPESHDSQPTRTRPASTGVSGRASGDYGSLDGS